MEGQRFSRRVLLGGTTAMAVLGVAACTASPSPVNPPATPKRLSVGATLEPGTLDITLSSAVSIPQLLLYNVYETLVKLDSDGKIKPLLAERWDVSADGLTYTFNLHPLAKFPHGNAVTAADVVASIERMRKATNPAIVPTMKLVKNVAEQGPKTVTVTLSRPSNMWLYEMTSSAGIVFDPSAFGPSGSDLATKPVGSGPFAFSSWTKGDRIVLTRNTAYWGTPPRFDEVTFRYFLEPNAMISAMLSGELDIISNLQAPQAIDQFTDTARFTVLDGTTTGEVTMGFNHLNPALAKLEVRQAICYAIDRAALIKTVWNGKGTLIGSMVPPTDPYYEDLSGTYPYNPAKAKDLLAAAGYAGGLTLRLRVPITKYATDSAVFVASQLKQVGITAVVEELDFSGRWLPEVFTKGDYDMTIVNHAEPRDIVMFANPTYYWHYNNPAFQALIAKADAEPVPEFISDMKKAARLLADDAAACWLFLMPNLVVTTADISGVPVNATTLSFDLTTVASRG